MRSQSQMSSLRACSTYKPRSMMRLRGLIQGSSVHAGRRARSGGPLVQSGGRPITVCWV